MSEATKTIKLKARAIQLNFRRKKDKPVILKLNFVAPRERRDPTDLVRVIVDEWLDNRLIELGIDPAVIQSARPAVDTRPVVDDRPQTNDSAKLAG